MQLACSYSPHLHELLRAGMIPLDRIEVGPWFSLDKIRAVREQFPDHPVHFHDSNSHSFIGLLPGALRRIRAYHTVTDSPFASCHISLLLPGTIRFVKRGLPVPRLPAERAARRLVWQIKQVQQALDKPVILENMPGLRNKPLEGVPSRIRDILTTAGTGMLLDLGHAMIAAEINQMSIEDYLKALPLERVRQLHLHRAGTDASGKLIDTHEALRDEDYPIIEWLLAHTQPDIVTLEYWRDREAIRQQLHRLQAIINTAS